MGVPIPDGVIWSLLLVLVGKRRFHLYSVHAVHTVDEQNEDEDERNLHLLVRLQPVALDGAVVAYLHPIL
jgi:hypothetical protein